MIDRISAVLVAIRGTAQPDSDQLQWGSESPIPYFAAIEPQRRLAPHVHLAIRGTVSRAELREVIAATYHQVWWPGTSAVKFDGSHLPVWDEGTKTYLDPETGERPPTWDEALDAIGAEDEPLDVARFGDRFDAQDVLAGSRDANRCIGYLTNNCQHMKYDKALAKGWPIATGMIEGACRFVIEDRFGITGARWSPDGAETILKLRAVVVNGDLDQYMDYYKNRYRSEHHLARYDPASIPDLGLTA